MKDLLLQFIELTEVDAARVEIERQLSRYPAMIERLDKAETAEQKDLEKAKAAQSEAQAARRQAEKDIAGLREQIKNCFIYDEGMNIIGSRQPSSLVPAHDYPPEAVSIIEPVRDLLRARYGRESGALADLGLLSPKHWPSLVMPEPVAK